jgi:DNA invertase Pin-like site-specific DNA recombinase
MPANNSSNGRIIKAAALYRNSDDRQENSVDRQRQGVEPYARHKGYETVAEYVFDGIPGDEIGRHPDWHRLMQDAKAGQWSVLLMDEPSRLSRGDPDVFVAEVKLPLKRAGVKVDSVNKGLLDWDTLAGDIMTLVHSHESREEVRKMSRRVLGGMARLARDGLFFGWMCPYGLRILRTIDPETGKVMDRQVVFGPEEEVRVVRFVFDAIANRGWSLRRVCRELELRGVKPPPGNGTGKNKAAGHWSTSTIHRWLFNRKYVGDLPWNQRHAGKYSAWKNGTVEQTVPNERHTYRHGEEDWIVVPDLIPPLIDRDVFLRAQAVLAASQERSSPARGLRYLFTHLLVCGDCGAFLRGGPDRVRKEQKSYLCGKYKEYGTTACYHNSILEKPLLQSILAVLLDDVLNPARLDAIEAELAQKLEAERDAGAVQRLRQQMAELEHDIDKGHGRLLQVAEDLLAGAEAKIRAWKQERDHLAARLDELEGGAGESKNILDEARRQVWRLREALAGDDEEAQATVIRAVVSKIELRFTHEKTNGQYSRKGKGGKLLNRPAGAILYVRPGLGLSCLSTSFGRSPG